jgi:hypothetical protein
MNTAHDRIAAIDVLDLPLLRRSQNHDAVLGGWMDRVLADGAALLAGIGSLRMRPP